MIELKNEEQLNRTRAAEGIVAENFPVALCTSFNEEVVHGIPGLRALKNGDIISIDCGVFYEESRNQLWQTRQGSATRDRNGPGD